MGFEFLAASPIVSISIFAIIAIVFDARKENTQFGFVFALIGLVVSALFSIYTMTISQEEILAIDHASSLTRNTITFGGYAAYFDLLFTFSAILSFIAAKPYFDKFKSSSTEFYNMVLFSVAGMMLIAHSNHMLTVFIGIELMSVAFYVMAGFFRFNIRSVEASLKYFLLGAFATGFLVYGMAMIYGATGSFEFPEIYKAITTNQIHSPIYLKMGIGLLIVGLGFKVAAFPFHNWAPDVYTGSPTVVTAFMSTAGKAAALIALIVIAKALMPPLTESDLLDNTIITTQNVIAILAALTMLVGNISAIVQKDVKRMLAFSSVAHAGYLLMGIVANNESGWQGIMFYITAYTFMQLGAFIIVSIFEKENNGNMSFSDYAGLSTKHPVMAFIMALFMFSLAGIPPMAGFFGKWTLFNAAIDAGFTWLTIVGVVSSIISMYFYIGLVKYMYFKPKEDGVVMTDQYGIATIPLYISTICIIILGIRPTIITDIIELVM